MEMNKDNIRFNLKNKDFEYNLKEAVEGILEYYYDYCDLLTITKEEMDINIKEIDNPGHKKLLIKYKNKYL